MNRFKDDQNYEQKWIKEIEGHPALSGEQFVKKKAQVLRNQLCSGPSEWIERCGRFY